MYTYTYIFTHTHAHTHTHTHKVSDLLIDEDAVVRKEFRAMAKQLMRGAEPAAMAPHLRMFIGLFLHVCTSLLTCL